jgi:hypothetical protein
MPGNEFKPHGGTSDFGEVPKKPTSTADHTAGRTTRDTGVQKSWIDVGTPKGLGAGSKRGPILEGMAAIPHHPDAAALRQVTMDAGSESGQGNNPEKPHEEKPKEISPALPGARGEQGDTPRGKESPPIGKPVPTAAENNPDESRDRTDEGKVKVASSRPSEPTEGVDTSGFGEHGGKFGPGTPHKQDPAFSQGEGMRWKQGWDRFRNVFSSPPSRSEHIRIVGYNTKDPDTITDVRDAIDNFPVHYPPEAEIPKTWRRRRELKEINTAVVEYGREELGIDFARKVPPASEVHYYDSPEAYRHAIEVNNIPYIDISRAITTREGDIIQYEESDPGFNAGLTQHEIFHRVSPRLAIVKRINDREISPDSDDGRTQLVVRLEPGGFMTPNGSFQLLIEPVIEMSNQDAIYNKWGDHRILGNYEHGLLHAELVILTDDLIRKTAIANDVSYKDVFRGLQRGHFQGDLRALRAIRDVVGAEGMRALATRPERGKWVSEEDKLEIARRAGLHDAAERIEALSAGDEITLMGDESSLGFVKTGKLTNPTKKPE